MSQCASTSDCFKASLQFKIDRSLGQATQTETKAEWQNTVTAATSAVSSRNNSPTGAGSAPHAAAKSVTSPHLGSNFDADG
jgi:hypothetical protein